MHFSLGPIHRQRQWRIHPGRWSGQPPPSSSGSSPGSVRGQPARTSLLGRGRSPLERGQRWIVWTPLPPVNSELRWQYGPGHCPSAETGPRMTWLASSLWKPSETLLGPFWCIRCSQCFALRMDSCFPGAWLAIFNPLLGLPLHLRGVEGYSGLTHDHYVVQDCLWVPLKSHAAVHSFFWAVDNNLGTQRADFFTRPK